LQVIINLVAACIIDFFAGDPVVKIHPVRIIGGMLSVYEKAFYRIPEKLIGGLLLVTVSLLTVFVITLFLEFLKPFLEFPFSLNVLSVILIYFLLCNRDMVRASRRVYRSLVSGDIHEARTRLARIVGRDTEELTQPQIIKAVVESLAENIVDGFTAPVFYLILGGVPFAYMYKTVNTIDSRFGYRNVRYERFGKIGARLDDILNFVPARLNFFFILCATGFRKRVFRTMVRYGRHHPSPNSGIAEAGFAGGFGIALGGDMYYGGSLHIKPVIGEADTREITPELISEACALYWRVIAVTLCFYLAAVLFFKLPFVFG
jgi:adenosylcobinamide-phosphate synthase